MAKDGVSLKPRVSGLKPRVSIGKAWVVTGESRVHHGFGLLEKIDPVFSSYFENSSIKTRGYTEKNRYMFFLGNPGFIMETRGLEHGSSETRGLQANPTKSKGFVVQGIYIYIYMDCLVNIQRFNPSSTPKDSPKCWRSRGV